MSIVRGAPVSILAAILAAALATTGCASRGSGASSSGGGFSIFGIGRTSAPARPATVPAGLGVNSYLWRAALDTLAFMPLQSADPFGGVIITDWYTNPEKPDERFKATVYILDTRLRADGLNVTVFKQVRDAQGQWVNAEVAGQTEIDIENAILTRARQLRLSNLNDRG